MNGDAPTPGIDDRVEERSGDPDHVVTAFLRDCECVLLLRRSGAVGTYPETWGGISGYAEGDPDEQVRVEIREETGLDPESDVSPVRSGRPIRFEDSSLGREWMVHPYLFDRELDGYRERVTDAREIELSEEHTEYVWVPPTAIATGEYDTVPKLWEAYERVAPTVRSIAADDDHGAAYLSIRALAVLRDRAGLLVRERSEEDEDRTTAIPADLDDEWDELVELAQRLLEARPSMAVLRNRVNRAMTETIETRDDGVSTTTPWNAEAVLDATIRGIERAVEADTAAAKRASEFATGRVLTLSRSGTVRDALRSGAPERVFVAESRPAREGVDVTEELVTTLDIPVTLHTDAAASHVLAWESIDAVLVGADTILPDGSVVNKTGTRGTAIAAAREAVPVYVVAASDKLSTEEAINLESGGRSAVYAGDAPVDVANPTFDVTPADCVTGIVTERGVLEPADVEEVAEELREWTRWQTG